MKQKISLLVELSEFEMDVATDYAETRMYNSLEEFLSHLVQQNVCAIAYDHEWEEQCLSEEELREFENNYHDDRLIDSLRDTNRDD